MRLIDADAIKYCNYDLDNYHSFRAVEEEEIVEMPTIDAVVVVRCKDCKAYDTKGCCPGFGWCLAYEAGRTDEDFCQSGERK